MGEFNESGEGLPDCRHVTEAECADIWRKGNFASVTGRITMMAFRFRMTVGDVIYAKEEQDIVGCGIVASEYDYDPDIMGGAAEWAHFVRVNWDSTFRKVHALLGAERIALLRLQGDRLTELEVCLRASGQTLKGKHRAGDGTGSSGG